MHILQLVQRGLRTKRHRRSFQSLPCRRDLTNVHQILGTPDSIFQIVLPSPTPVLSLSGTCRLLVAHLAGPEQRDPLSSSKCLPLQSRHLRASSCQNLVGIAATCVRPTLPPPHLTHLEPKWLLRATLHLKTTQEETSLHHPKKHSKIYCNNLTDTPTEQSVLLSQSASHTSAHLMQPISSVARRLMLLHPAAANATNVVTSGPATASLLRLSVWRRC